MHLQHNDRSFHQNLIIMHDFKVLSHSRNNMPFHLLVQSQSQLWSSVGSSTVGTGADTWQRRTHSAHQPLADAGCTPWFDQRQRGALV